MKRKSIFLTFGLLVLSWIGCVENDLPYPTIVGQITEMEVAGMTSCRILGASNMVEIKVADTIDLAGFARRKAGRYGGHEGLSGFGCLSRYRSFPGYRFCFG